MKVDIGHKIQGFPFEGLKKISDLIFFEGPILSHYKSGKDNLLFYWVDYGEAHNRWLVFKIEEEQLANFLRKRINLKSIVANQINSFVFITDINSDLSFENNYLVKSFVGIEEYMPEEDSFFKLSIPSIYDDLITKYQGSYYIETLRDSALYFKLTPQDIKYSTTVSIDNVVTFLNRIKISYLNYVDAKFRNDFGKNYLNSERLNKALEDIKKQLFPRIVDLHWASFGAGVSSDFAIGVASNEIKEWKKEIFVEYKNDVFNLDYNSEEALNKISSKFTDEQKENIFKPILNSLNDKDFKVAVTDSDLVIIKTLNPVSEKAYNRLIQPKHEKAKEVESEKRLVNIVLEIPVNGDIKSLKSKDLQQGLLFGEDVSYFTYKTRVIESSGITIILNKVIECQVDFIDGMYNVKFEPLKIETQGDTRQTYIRLFNLSFVNEYIRLINDSIPLSKEDLVLKKILIGLIKSIKNEV